MTCPSKADVAPSARSMALRAWIGSSGEARRSRHPPGDLNPDTHHDIGCQVYVLNGASSAGDCLGKVCLEIPSPAERARDSDASDHKPAPDGLIDGLLQELREGEGDALDRIRHFEPGWCQEDRRAIGVRKFSSSGTHSGLILCPIKPVNAAGRGNQCA